ncbi:TetR/AcrR family transcriptional regulator [Methylobacterium iners]|uniref:HTH-type transcriptional regulator n=1 Tax=Methylobacterium iners TaxID=418707 RepID=A0ABQ4RVH4_9HYPH|nr:TetR/AcrR family transcriptional regulator [Methylobacterium iners]GJD93597.1 putative HTH-type transcriptional regulator [Methylobacterium iners]
MGRPRSESSREAILEAAFKLLVERGYGGFAIEVVASAARCGKTTVYRWWRSKAELAVDAFFHATREELRLPDTGSAREDFRSQILELGVLLRGERGQALAAMLGGARTDPALAKALGQRWLEPRRRWGFERMSHAAATGELRPGVEPTAALSLLYGPLYAPLLFGGEIPAADAIRAYLDLACVGIFVDSG